MSRLANKIVLITGASAGIGAACAREFAKNAASLVLMARRQDRLQQLKDEICQTHPDVQVHCAAVDVSSRESVFEAVKSLPEPFKSIDVLVNNAGLVIGLDRVEDVSPEAVDTMISTNVKGVINMLQAVLPEMKTANRGHIINIGSVAGIEAYARGGVYCATKHALDALTRTLRFELMDTPIRVSEVKPGMVETEFSVVRFSGDKSRADKVYEGMEPLTAQDIAELVVFVASRPSHVNIADTLVFPTAQAAATTVHRSSS